MRKSAAWTCLGLMLVVLGAVGALGVPAKSQDRGERQADNNRNPAARAAFDVAAQFAFKQQLSPDERVLNLIALQSRFELADPEYPLPTSEPTQVFYVKFRETLDGTFARALEEAGASFVGYAGVNTHFLRARDADALQKIGDMLRQSGRVSGTLLRAPQDACDERTWTEFNNPALHHGEYSIMFWGDIGPRRAFDQLGRWGAEIIEASADHGEYDLETPFVIAGLSRAAFLDAVRHPFVERIEHRPVLTTWNVDSQQLHRARAQDVGPPTSYNLTGAGLVVGVWDGGTGRDTHNAFQNAGGGSPFAGISGHPSGSRVLRANTNNINSHATHVTGTIVSNGAGNAGGRGFAPNAHAATYYWNSMQSERRLARYNWRIVTDNHSYGQTNASAGGYNTEAATNDIETRDLLLNQFKACGNDGSQSYTIGSDGCSKNTYLIGAVNDSGTIASFSSRGPSVDGRVIPHFTANGTSLLSTHSQHDSAYAQQGWSGTSMASPSAAGGVTLLTELWHREHANQPFSPDLGRGLLAVTADDRGNQGPDYQYGWGVIDVRRAADLIMADKNSNGAHIVRGQVRHGEVIDYPLSVPTSGQPLRVVLSWLDIQASSGASVTLINDLDIELIAPGGGTTHYPWRGLQSQQGNQNHQFTRTGPNRRDNLLVVDVNSAAAGTWTVRVRGHNIPANPQPSVPNNIVGYVLLSERPMTTSKAFVGDPLNTGSPVSIPDNNVNGVTRNFNVSASGTVAQVRLYHDIRHPARGDLNIYIIHPDSTTSHIQQQTTSTRRDMIAISPDTRQYYSEVNVFVGKAAGGTWQVRVNDTRSGNTGTIRYLALEIDYISGGTPGNQPPVANAGPNQTVNEGTLVTLNGSGSFDPDSDPLTYQWTQIVGPSVSLSNPTHVMPTFTAPMVATNTLLRFQLTVNDGNGGQDSDTVDITVQDVGSGPNQPPVADAGPNIVVMSGDIGVLDGSNSFDPDGDPLTYQWTALTNPGLITLSNPNSAIASFTAPTVASATNVLFELVVNDGNGGVASDTALVTIEPNPAGPSPVAVAGDDQYVAWGSTVNLDGSASHHPNQDPLTYFWQQIGGTNQITILNEDTEFATFVAPNEDDVIVIQLRVTDSNSNMSTDTLVVVVNETGQGPPTSGGGGGSSDGGCSTGEHSSTAWWLLMLAGLACVLVGVRLGLRKSECV